MSVATKFRSSDVPLAWATFVTTGNLDDRVVRPEIAESWQRCYNANVNPYDGFCYTVLDSPELEELLETKKCLFKIARPFMEHLYKFVAGTGFIVMLTDERGYILEALGDSDTLECGKQIKFQKGSKWTEEEVGTNAIGTSLVIKKPLQVSAAEHYCQKHHLWTCSACPIFDENGQIIGVLDMSGPSSETHLHTLGMVFAAVQAINDQIKIENKNRELTLTNNRLTNVCSEMSDGVIMVDDNCIITHINPVSEKILGVSANKVSGRLLKDFFKKTPNIEKMLATGKEFKDIEVMLESGGGSIHCLVTGKASRDNQNRVSGGLLFIAPIKKVKKLVNRFSGSYATFQFKDIIGNSDEFLEVVQIAYLAADSISNVLIEGESGTGKEVFAQAIHNKSPRKNGPFVAINCGAIPRELVASELFGYVEGAFTGAMRGGRPGKFEMASGGTIFLDEIGEMSLEQQVALLRVLQEKKVTRVGGNESIPVDVRIICATNKDLEKQVKEGKFRQDLFYRLNVIKLNLPPLRKRREDIPLLFDYVLKEISERLGTSIPYVEPEVIYRLQQYNWPGNVRQLQNMVERMLSISNTDTIGIQHLPDEVISTDTAEIQEDTNLCVQEVNVGDERIKRKKQVEKQERDEISLLLARYGGNISRVAREMGVSRNTVYRKIRLYDISI